MVHRFELVHVGVNIANEEDARSTAQIFSLLFNLEVRQGQKSIFGGQYFECMKAPFLGTHGHIAMCTDDLAGAMEELKSKGFSFNMDTAPTTPTAE